MKLPKRVVLVGVIAMATQEPESEVLARPTAKAPACSAVLPGVTAEPSGFLMRIWVLLRPTAVGRSFARYSSSYCNFSTNHLVR
mgnify:CR=1 FL=1